MSASSRDGVLALLNGQRPGRVPAFSGLISVTESGLESVGLRFSEVHQDAEKMAQAAASTHRLFGFEAVTVPLDMCVEAEALGASVNFYEDAQQPIYPMVVEPIADAPDKLIVQDPSQITTQGRVPLVVEAIKRLKAELGDTVAVGAWVPGPFTLAMYVIAPDSLMLDVADGSDSVGGSLDRLVEVLIVVGQAYREAGADFLTIHEMGGSPGYLGPIVFETLVLPRVQRLVAALPAPRVLSICGRTNHAMPLLAQSGADAISVDQLNDVAQSRELLGPDVVLLGNIDPVATLGNGSEDDVTAAVEVAIAAGVDAIWPGCDLWPEVSAENMNALMRAARQYAGS